MSRTAKGVVIRPDCTHEEIVFKQLPDYQQAVGGLICPIVLYDYNGEEIACAYADDDGLSKQLSLNPLASAISFLFGNTPYLVGNVVVVGRADKSGEHLNIPDFILKLVQNICAKTEQDQNV